MRYLAWNLALSAWLLVSAFALGHTFLTASVTALLAVLILTFSLASPGVPGLRFGNSGLALVLAWSALLAPDISALAALNNGVVAALVFALSVVPGRSTSGRRAGT